MMNEHSDRPFVPYAAHYPQRSYIPLSDDQILDMVISQITKNSNNNNDKKMLSPSTDDIRERVSSPLIVTSSSSTGDIPERVSSPVIPCDSTVDGEGHVEGVSKEDNENTPLSRNDETDDHTKSRPEKHSSEMGKEGTWSIKPVAEEMEEDLYCMTDLGVPNASQQGKPEAAMPSPDILSSIQMIVLPHEEALKISCLQKGQSDTHTKSHQYEDVTDEESPQMDMNPLHGGESLLEPSCKCPFYVETDDGDFECQPCPACVRQRELQQIKKKDTTDLPSVYRVDCNPAAVYAVGFLQPKDDCFEFENETEDEEEDDDWDCIGPIGISSLKYIPPDVGSKVFAPDSSQLEVFENMECFKEAKAKQLGIAPDRIHGFEVDQSNTGTAVPIAPARSRSRLSYGASPQRSPQHITENGSNYPMPQSPVSMEDSSADSDCFERKGDRRKVKRRKLAKSKNVVSDYSKSKAESDQHHNTPADCQKRGLISPEIEDGPRTPQRSPQSNSSENSSETENSSDCSMSPLQGNRLTVSKQCWEEGSNSPHLYRSLSNYESGEHDNGSAASSPLRRCISHEPELESQRVYKTFLETPKNDSEKKQAKNRDDKDKEDDSGGCRPESGALRLFKSREASFSKQRSSKSTVNSDRAKEKPSNSRKSSAVTKANVSKPREGPPVSKQGPSALGASRMSSSATSGRQVARKKVLEACSVLYTPDQTTGKMTSVETVEEKTMTMPGPPHRGPTFRQRHDSHESAPGQRRNSHESAPGQRRNSHRSAPEKRRNSHESAPRQRHNSHESAHPLRKKTMEEARGETKRKSTPVHPTEQSDSKGLANYKWGNKKNLPRGFNPNRLRETKSELDSSD